MDISQEELIHSEIEAIKNSITMLKVIEGKVVNRILVHTKDIEQFLALGYLDSRLHDHNPQIGHPLNKQEHRREVLKQFTRFEKFKIFCKNLFRKKNKYGSK